MSQIEKRRQVRLLLEGKKHSQKEISKIIGVSLSTVYVLKAKLANDDSFERLKGSGRHSKTNPWISDTIAQQIRRNPSISLRCLATKCPLRTSKDTVASCLKKLQYTRPYPLSVPLLSEKNRVSRLEWAKKNIANDWQHAVFADEASIWLFRGRIRMWTKGGKISRTPTVKHSQKINI